MEENAYRFELPTHERSIIKVLGVGGGGSNAVSHMFTRGIKDVEFVVCNTDAQALKSSAVTNKLQLGANLTEGLGAGANPEVGRQAALESKSDIRELLSENTKMVFVTAGMGGGTGTGAAPVIARIAKELDILTVGIVTAPFAFEGPKKRQAADQGIAELKENCDTVLVIMNDRLREIYGNQSVREAFSHADGVLSTAARSIAEIITVTSDINVDFEDVKTVMKGSGPAVMGSAIASGEDRALTAVADALRSPLLNSTDIAGARKVLLSMTYGPDAEMTMDELTEITDYVHQEAGDQFEMIFGQGLDPTLGDGLRVTIIATGFEESAVRSAYERRTVYDLDSEQPLTEEPKAEVPSPVIYEAREQTVPGPASREETKPDAAQTKPQPVIYELDQRPEERPAPVAPAARADDEFERRKRLLLEQSKERLRRIKGLNSFQNMAPDEFKERLEVPAYKRRGVDLKDAPDKDADVSRYHLGEKGDLLSDNRFLHDNVD